MKSASSIEIKDNIKKLEINAYFESVLALKLAVNTELFPIVNTISKIILNIIQSRKNEIIEKLTEKDNLKMLQGELYTQFGALTEKKTTPESVLNDIQSVLENKNANLIKIMPIHAIFGYRILRLLYEEQYEKIRSNFKEAKLYIEHAKKYVARNDEKKVIPTSQLGVSRNPHFCKKIHEMPESQAILSENAKQHKTSLERFKIDHDAEAIKEFVAHSIPLAAGPSSHTLALMTAAKLYETLTEQPFSNEDLCSYKTAYFAYFGTAGFHTFFEVENVFARCFDLSCKINNYNDSLPENIKKSIVFEELKKLFPTQLNKIESPKSKYNPHVLFTQPIDETKTNINTTHLEPQIKAKIVSNFLYRTKG